MRPDRDTYNRDVVHRTLLNSAISGTASRQTNHVGAKLTTNLVEQVFRI